MPRHTFPTAILLTLLFLTTPACALRPAYAFSQKPATPKEIRIVSVTALVAKDEPPDVHRTEIIKGAINFSSFIFEKNFRVRFQLRQILPWDYTTGKEQLGMNAALENLQHLNTGLKTEILLAFTSKTIERLELEIIDGEPIPVLKTIWGGANTSTPEAIIHLNDRVSYITLHELLHIFGAEHVSHPAEPTIMRGESFEATESIDQANTAQVLANRERPFNKK